MRAIKASLLHSLRIRTLADLIGGLSPSRVRASDVALVLPADTGSLILGSAEQLLQGARGFQGAICVAAATVSVSSPEVAAKMADAVARSTGWRRVRVYPHPYALLGPSAAIAALAADLSAYPTSLADDADRISTALLEGSHNLVLDSGGQIFHAIDGTATDCIPVAGWVRAGGERPLVVLDAGAPRAREDLRGLQVRLADPSGRDLARLFGYDDAVEDYQHVLKPAREIVVTPFWTPEFCATVIRAAEIAGRWETPDSRPNPVSEVPLRTLSPRLLALVEQDLRVRVWPRLASHWPKLPDVALQGAVVVRAEAGVVTQPSGQSPLGAQISGLVRLNRGYLGGTHFFPRQAWDDRRLSTGSLLLWPSAFTHPHRAESVKRGVRYSLALSWHSGPT